MSNDLLLSSKTTSLVEMHESILAIFQVNMDKERNTGRVQCMKCFEDFQASINFLSEPIDVYNEWVDACEAANA